MTRKNNAWSDKEENLLFNYVVDGIQVGKPIVELLTSFSNTYMVSKASVSNRWQVLAKRNEGMVQVAKDTWLNWGKPERDATVKAEKEAAKRLARLQAQSAKARKQWRAGKAKREAKGAQVRFDTNRAEKPSANGVYVKVDSHGIVMVHNSITA
jgi:hypothetical protein